MAKKYLDYLGLVHLWTLLKIKFANKVDKEDGKGLSTNDYTTTEKNKLAGIASGAEVNVNADWNATTGDALILNKPTIPSKISELTNDSNYITSADVPEASSTTPKMDGTAAVGSETKWAKGDHVHPSDTSKVSVSDTITESQINALFTTTTISFTIARTTYLATSGMTWGNWVSSNYNTGGFSVNGSSIYQSSSSKYINYNSQEVQSTDTIIADASYTLHLSDDTE